MTKKTSPTSPFKLDIEARISNPLARKAFQATRPALESLLGLRYLDKHYQLISGTSPKERFTRAALNELNVKYTVSDGDPKRIPDKGPGIIVANHPFGGLEGIILADFLSAIRPDVKLMANFLLRRVGEIQDFFIAVDPFDGPHSSKNNIAPLREAIDWVNNGGLLCIFPSGAVSHYHWKKREIVDPPWSLTVARIVQKTKAPVVPIYFAGHNSMLFQAMGTVHPLLRTMMLPRELANKRGRSIELRIGNAIAHEKLASLSSRQEISDYLRLRTYILGHRDQSPLAERVSGAAKQQAARKEDTNHVPVAEAEAKELYVNEVKNLPPDHLLITADNLQVYFMTANQAPHLLREIGRLRELTFRAVQEGTGKALDVDNYDNYYTHLFVWNREAEEVVGAYRLAKTDAVLEQFGRKGLYTYSLFHYQSELLEQMGPALELGRSFIRREYQKSYSPLLMLWKGICAYVLLNPEYKILFGTVCINSEYDTASRQLITRFLEENSYFPELARMIKARNPMRKSKLRGVDKDASSVVVKDLSDISDLLQEMEATHHQIPVLLRQYLKLGGRLLGFNVDENFGDVLDGLIYVDFMESDPKLLARFMSREGVSTFRAFHGDNGNNSPQKQVS